MYIIKMRKIIILTILLLISCSSDEPKDIVILPYTYNIQELDMIQTVNQYRISHSLNTLNDVQHISALCEQSNKYMILYNQPKHYYFHDRVENLQRIGYTKVSAVICYNYTTNQSALSVLDNNATCHNILIGDFTDFGVSITTNTNGKKYYTLTFVK
jgi:uncharacterized protein YkwD